jgi:hypothetical protein
MRCERPARDEQCPLARARGQANSNACVLNHLPEGEVPSCPREKFPAARETAGSSKWKAGGERAVEAKQKQRHHRRRGSGNGTRSPPHSTPEHALPILADGVAAFRPRSYASQRALARTKWCTIQRERRPMVPMPRVLDATTRDSLSRLHYAGEMPSSRMEEARCGALG